MYKRQNSYFVIFVYFVILVYFVFIYIYIYIYIHVHNDHVVTWSLLVIRTLRTRCSNTQKILLEHREHVLWKTAPKTARCSTIGTLLRISGFWLSSGCSNKMFQVFGQHVIYDIICDRTHNTRMDEIINQYLKNIAIWKYL